MKDSTFQVNSQWMGNLLTEHGINHNNRTFIKMPTPSSSSSMPSMQKQQRQPTQMPMRKISGLTRVQNANRRTLYTGSQVSSSAFCFCS